MSCGGHGYSQCSGFPSMYVNNTPNCTYEGENTVLYLQTARFLVKQMREKQSHYPESVRYLQKPPSITNKRKTKDLKFLEDCFMARAYNLVKFASDQVNRSMKIDKDDLVAALNKNAVHLVRCAQAHTHYFVVKNFNKKLLSLQGITQPTKMVLDQLASLYVYEGIAEYSGDFLEQGLLTPSEIADIRQASINLLPVIRPNSVALVDAFEFHDRELNSILGRFDGNVYENMLKWAQSSPLNKTDVHPSYEKYLKPLFNRNKSKL